MEKADLLKYLNDCKDLELTYQSECEEQQKLRQSMKNLGIPGNINPPNRDVIAKNVRANDNGASHLLNILFGILAVIDIIISLGFGVYYGVFDFIVMLIVGGVIGFIIWFVLGVILSIIYESTALPPKIEQQYQIAMQNYYMALQQDQNRVEYEKRQIQLIQSRIDRIEAQKGETTRILEKMYAIGIVYPKYQALVPIVMFCEYFESGRCSELEGHEGAYNIYESELRQNIIISKLDDISGKLEQIKQNQYMLYVAIEEGNQRVNQLCNATYDSARRLEDIQRNTAISAENSRVAAQNTRIIGQIEAYKLLSK